MNPPKTIERAAMVAPEQARHEATESMALDPPTEELLIANSDIEGRKQLLSTYIIDGYLKGHFDLVLTNPVHKGIHDTLAARGELRERRSTHSLSD